jgi:hypothetical protein
MKNHAPCGPLKPTILSTSASASANDLANVICHDPQITLTKDGFILETPCPQIFLPFPVQGPETIVFHSPLGQHHIQTLPCRQPIFQEVGNEKTR